MRQARRFRRLCCSSAAGQVMAAATVLHGGGSLHALAFADGEAQILSASGSVAASARVFETGAPYVCCLQRKLVFRFIARLRRSLLIVQHRGFHLRADGADRMVECRQLLHHRLIVAGAPKHQAKLDLAVC
jgi:hypothetical protein